MFLDEYNSNIAVNDRGESCRVYVAPVFSSNVLILQCNDRIRTYVHLFFGMSGKAITGSRYTYREPYYYPLSMRIRREQYYYPLSMSIGSNSPMPPCSTVQHIIQTRHVSIIMYKKVTQGKAGEGQKQMRQIASSTFSLALATASSLQTVSVTTTSISLSLNSFHSSTL